MLVDLVLLELLARGQVDRDHASVFVGAQQLRRVGLHVERGDVPGVHGRASYARLRSACRAIQFDPGVSVTPCAMIDVTTASAAMFAIRSPCWMPSPSTSSENVIVATPFGPNQPMKRRVSRSVAVPSSAIHTATGRARSSVKTTMATAATPSWKSPPNVSTAPKTTNTPSFT